MQDVRYILLALLSLSEFVSASLSQPLSSPALMSTKLIGFIYDHTYEHPRLPSTLVALFALLPYQYFGNGALGISHSLQVWVHCLFLHFSHLFWFVLLPLLVHLGVLFAFSLAARHCANYLKIRSPICLGSFSRDPIRRSIKRFIKWTCETRMCQSAVQKGVETLFQWLLIRVKRKLFLIKNHSTDFWNAAQELERSWRRPKRSIACLCTTTRFLKPWFLV